MLRWPAASYRLEMFPRFTAMYLWKWNIAKPHKRSPVIVDPTQILSPRKADNEHSQHIDVTGRTINNLKFYMNIRIKVFVCKF